MGSLGPLCLIGGLGRLLWGRGDESRKPGEEGGLRFGSGEGSGSGVRGLVPLPGRRSAPRVRWRRPRGGTWLR